MNQEQNTTYVQQPYVGETTEQKEERSQIYSKLFLPSLIYALLYTFLLYENFDSITMPLFVIATIGYCYYFIKSIHKANWKTMLPYATGMILLGISTCCTASGILLFFNFVGIVLLLIYMLLHQFFNVKEWTLAKYTLSFWHFCIGSFGSIADFFQDHSCHKKLNPGKRNSKLGYILLGIGISVPFLVFIIALLSSADVVFNDFIKRIFDFDLDFGDFWGIAFTFLFALFASYCGIRFLGKRKISENVPDLRRFEPLVANTALSLTAVVYLLFSGIQILYLFIGNMTLPEGYTYAEYAREGFFQLLLVSSINVMLVVFFLGCFKENGLLKILLTVISVCTYVMLASSALRMCLYISVYRLTFLRIFVLWFLFLLSLILAGVILQIYKKSFPLFRYIVLVVSVCYIGFSFAHPDYWIATYNLSHASPVADSYKNGNAYLQNLSADAAPAIVGCEDEWVEEYKEDILSESKNDIRHFNFSTWWARRLFQE